MKRVFVDTGAWFAFVNRADPDHASVTEVLDSFQGRLVSSNFVFDETVTLCLYRLGHSVAERVGATVLDPKVTDLVRVTADDEGAAWRLFLKRADKVYSFTDCTSFVLMRRLKLQTAVAVDPDFDREGFETLPGFKS